MLFDFLFLNFINFEYEINFIKDLWFYHFIDFCLLLTFEDISFIFFILYILTICIVNLSFLILKINWISLLISPIKLLSDFILIYIFTKIIFLTFYFFVVIYFKELNEILSLILLIFLGGIFVFFMIFFPYIFFKITNKILYKKIFNLNIPKNY